MGICFPGNFRRRSEEDDDDAEPLTGGRIRKGQRVLVNTKSAAEGQFVVQSTGNVSDTYDLAKKLGDGTFGTVYLGFHKTSNAERAVKAMLKDGLDAAMLRRETELLMSLDHPHIVRLFETFEDSKKVYLVMDLCLGGELFHRIVACGHFTEVQASVVMSQLLSGVKYLHEMDVCHRDLKPENCLLTSKDALANNCLKIIDFGMSCVAHKGTVMKKRVGSPLYIAPQVLMGRYTRSCDIWSCGVIMYILLSGEPPFAGSSIAEIFQSVRQSVFSMETGLWQKISADAKNLIKGLLQRMPKKRLTASEAMDHVWITQRAPKATGEVLPSSMFLNLKNFHAQNKLKRAALRIIAGQLSHRQIIQLRKAFGMLDANGDGLLTLEELGQGMEAAGLGSGPELEDIVRSMDVDGNGRVSYSEFIAAAIDRRSHLSEAVCRTAFQIFDINGDGVITEAELGQMLADKSVRDSVGREKVRQILAEVDKDGDGRIDFEEFMIMMGSGNDLSKQEEIADETASEEPSDTD